MTGWRAGAPGIDRPQSSDGPRRTFGVPVEPSRSVGLDLPHRPAPAARSGAFALATGWALTETTVSFPGAVLVSPTTAAVGLWAALFAAIGAVALTQTPDYVRFSQPLLLWAVLNAVAFLVTGAAVLGYLPAGLIVYAYWHVRVLVAVVGFAATGALLERSGPSGQHYVTAAGLEVSLLFIGLGAFTELVSGLYLLLAFVHPTPLALNAYPGDLGAGPDAAIQLALYAAGLGLVSVL